MDEEKVGWTDEDTNRWMGRWTKRQEMDKDTDEQTDGQKQTDRQTDRQTQLQTRDRNRDRQVDRGQRYLVYIETILPCPTGSVEGVQWSRPGVLHTHLLQELTCVCVYVCMCVCAYVCMCTCAYMHVCVCTHEYSGSHLISY